MEKWSLKWPTCSPSWILPVYVIDCLPNMVADEIKARVRRTRLVKKLSAAHPDDGDCAGRRPYDAGDSFLIAGRMEWYHAERPRGVESGIRPPAKRRCEKSLLHSPANTFSATMAKAAQMDSHPNDLGFMRQAENFRQGARAATQGRSVSQAVTEIEKAGRLSFCSQPAAHYSTRPFARQFSDQLHVAKQNVSSHALAFSARQPGHADEGIAGIQRRTEKSSWPSGNQDGGDRRATLILLFQPAPDPPETRDRDGCDRLSFSAYGISPMTTTTASPFFKSLPSGRS